MNDETSENGVGEARIDEATKEASEAKMVLDDALLTADLYVAEETMKALSKLDQMRPDRDSPAWERYNDLEQATIEAIREVKRDAKGHLHGESRLSKWLRLPWRKKGG